MFICELVLRYSHSGCLSESLVPATVSHPMTTKKPGVFFAPGSTLRTISAVIGPTRCLVTDSSHPYPMCPLSVWPLMIKDPKNVASLGREAQVPLGIQGAQV